MSTTRRGFLRGLGLAAAAPFLAVKAVKAFSRKPVEVMSIPFNATWKDGGETQFGTWWLDNFMYDPMPMRQDRVVAYMENWFKSHPEWKQTRPYSYRFGNNPQRWGQPYTSLKWWVRYSP